MAVVVNGNEIVLSGTVGDLYWDDSFSASEVITALAQVGRDQAVVIRLNRGPRRHRGRGGPRGDRRAPRG